MAANHRNEDAVPVSVIGENCRPPRMAIIEFGAVEQFGAALPKALFIPATAGLSCICTDVFLRPNPALMAAAGEKI